jgi:hypothetical protein
MSRWNCSCFDLQLGVEVAGYHASVTEVPAMITEAVLDKVLGFLAPLFLDVVGNDTAAARNAARSTLECYGARNDRELRFAALAIAFSFGALDGLSRAAQCDLPPNQVLRLRGNATALNRAAQQNEARLEKAQRLPATEAAQAPPQQASTDGNALLPPEAAGPEADLPASSDTSDLVAFVRSAWKAGKAAAATAPAMQPALALSRQQRRLAERQAEKQRQRELEQARLAQRVAQRDAACAGGHMALEA